MPVLYLAPRKTDCRVPARGGYTRRIPDLAGPYPGGFGVTALGSTALGSPISQIPYCTDQAVIAHAVRIGRYLYPNAFLTGPRVQRTCIRALEIVQSKAPAKRSLACAAVADGLGEFAVNVSSLRQRFLEAFRLRSETALGKRTLPAQFRGPATPPTAPPLGFV